MAALEVKRSHFFRRLPFCNYDFWGFSTIISPTVLVGIMVMLLVGIMVMFLVGLCSGNG